MSSNQTLTNFSSFLDHLFSNNTIILIVCIILLIYFLKNATSKSKIIYLEKRDLVEVENNSGFKASYERYRQQKKKDMLKKEYFLKESNISRENNLVNEMYQNQRSKQCLKKLKNTRFSLVYHPKQEQQRKEKEKLQIRRMNEEEIQKEKQKQKLEQLKKKEQTTSFIPPTIHELPPQPQNSLTSSQFFQPKPPKPEKKLKKSIQEIKQSDDEDQSDDQASVSFKKTKSRQIKNEDQKPSLKPSTQGTFSVTTSVSFNQNDKLKELFNKKLQQKELIKNQDKKEQIKINIGGFTQNTIPETSRNIPSFPVARNQTKTYKTEKAQTLSIQSNTVSEQPKLPSNIKLQSSEDILNSISKYAESLKIEVEIPTKMSNLGGAKSKLDDIYAFSKSFLSTINPSNDKQLTAFALKIYESIIYSQIKNTNMKEGIERIPPKERSKQVQKNSINCYILIINIYRVMGFEKIWLIVFGKILKLMSFTYNRKTKIDHIQNLDLITNKYMEFKGDGVQFSGKYMSRLDYLSYFMFGLTAFDPVIIFNQIRQNSNDSLGKLLEHNYRWDYKYFWILFDSISSNPHKSYFKPVVYMNVVSVLYPQMIETRQGRQTNNKFQYLYKYLLKESKQYLAKFRSYEEVTKLERDSSIVGNFEFEGDEFIDSIFVLKNRFPEKQKELMDNNFKDKANIFYYFIKSQK